jgi:hypothetical protein
MQTGGPNGRRYVFPVNHAPVHSSRSSRINWIGTALNAFYAAVRKALILVIVLRAVGCFASIAYLAWWFLCRTIDD